MANLPRANTRIDNASSGFASGADRIVVIGCVAKSADITPREFANTQDLLDKHGYSPAVDYAAMHFDATNLPVQFIGLPIATPGAIATQDAGGVTGTSVIAAVADTGGIMDEVRGELVITSGGTVGTDQIMASLRLNYDETGNVLRIGKASSAVIPYVGVKLTFAAGTLAEGDRFTFAASAPKWSATKLADVRAALVAQQLAARTWLLIGDASSSDVAALVTEANGYETANDRFVVARAQARDTYAPATMTGSPTLSFADADPGTITRSAGSWLTDGFRPGMTINVTGSALAGNNGEHVIGTVDATVITLAVDATVADATVAGCTVTGRELPADWRTGIIDEFDGITAERRIDIAAGRARVVSPITRSTMRRGASWAVSIREYQHDVQIATWRKSDGPLSGWSLEDEIDGSPAEHDERVNGGLVTAGFTTLRTWGNGPNGTFVSRSLTRALDDDPLVNTHHMHVANIACAVVQANTEFAIGDNLVLNDDGTGQEADIAALELRVTSALERELLSTGREGQRASAVKWTASRTDDLSVAEPELNGVMDLRLLGTLVRINTRVRVNPRA